VAATDRLLQTASRLGHGARRGALAMAGLFDRVLNTDECRLNDRSAIDLWPDLRGSSVPLKLEVAHDGSHAFRDVLADSAAALRMRSPAGLIIWDDYHGATPGVVRALNKLARELSLVRITHTRLAVYRVDAGR